MNKSKRSRKIRWNKVQTVEMEGASVRIHWKVVDPAIMAQPPVFTTYDPPSDKQIDSVRQMLGTIVSKGTADLLTKRGYKLVVSNADRGGSFVKLDRIYYHGPAKPKPLEPKP